MNTYMLGFIRVARQLYSYGETTKFRLNLLNLRRDC